MAQYQHLPIYKTTYELLQLVTRATSSFPKAYKYSLGDKLRPHARYVRRSTVRNAYHQLDGMCRAGAPVADVRNTANSYFGILRHALAWRERSRIGDMLRGYGHIVALQNHRMFTERIPL